MSSCFVIAEAGCNHNGSFALALQLVDAAKRARADAVKFQMFTAAKLKKPELKWLEMSEGQMKTIAAYCRAVGIEFMCTPFDVESLMFLLTLRIQRLKISSGCIKHQGLLNAAYESGMHTILSTGMSSISEIREALDVLGRDVTLLHCTSAYPCPIDAVNLRAMDLLSDTFNLPVGYSDHTFGITVSLAAAARGASVIEKHLTLDRKMDGPDHKASIEPNEFRTLVSGIRTIEEAMGDAVKVPQACELELKRAWHG